jgi:hypothetical protein
MLAAVNPLYVYGIVAIVFAGWAIPVVVSEVRRMRRKRRRSNSGTLSQYHDPRRRRR